MSHIFARMIPATILASGATLLMAAPAMAGSSAGTISVTLTVTAACAINGATSVPANVGSLGTIDFGSQSAVFDTIDAVLVAPNTSSGLSVLCSPNMTPSLTIDGGQHPVSNVRNMAGTSTQLPYHLYSTAGTSSEILIGTAVSLGTTSAGTPIVLPIHATTTSGGAALTPDTYTDSLVATLSW